jgi:hypothetical protein
MEPTDDRIGLSPQEKQNKEAMNTPPSSIGDYLEATSQAARNCYPLQLGDDMDNIPSLLFGFDGHYVVGLWELAA